MHVSAALDIDVVAVENSDEISVLLELNAPAAPTSDARPAATVQIVLDRSGSMGGEPLDAAKAALLSLVDRLDPTDHFGIVAFDDTVQIVSPAALLTDKGVVRRAIASIDAGGSTDLSSGYLRGLQEARRVCQMAGATVLILSDGHANAGVTDPVQLAGVAARAQQQGITTTTIGLGLNYSEELLSAIATGGAGNHRFAAGVDDTGPVLAGEVDGLLTKTIQAASLHLRLENPVQSAALLNDLPLVEVEGGAIVELGDLWAGETRRLLLRLTVPAVAALGLAQVATLELRYVTVPGLTEEVITLPISVNVVPADVAAGRVPDPAVTREVVFLTAQSAKADAEKALRSGDVTGAAAMYASASKALLDAPAAAGDEELQSEAKLLASMADQALEADTGYLTKYSTADRHHKTNKRGRGHTQA